MEVEAWQSCVHRILLEACMEEDDLARSSGHSALEEPDWAALRGLSQVDREKLLTKIMKVVVACCLHCTWKSLSKFSAFGENVMLDDGPPMPPLPFCDFPRCTLSLEEMSQTRPDHKFEYVNVARGTDGVIRNAREFSPLKCRERQQDDKSCATHDLSILSFADRCSG